METPHHLADERIELAAEYSQVTDELTAILSIKPRVWMELRQKYSSDKATDRAWEVSDDGVQEMRLKLRLKAIEKRMSAAKTKLDVLADEARNLY